MIVSRVIFICYYLAKKSYGFIKIYDGTKYLVLLSLKSMTLYMTKLHILQAKKAA